MKKIIDSPLFFIASAAAFTYGLVEFVRLGVAPTLKHYLSKMS